MADEPVDGRAGGLRRIQERFPRWALVVVAAVLVLGLGLASWALARLGSGPADELVDASGERLADVRVTPDTNNALRAEVEVDGDVPGRLAVEVTDPAGRGWRVEPHEETSSVQLVQLRPQTTYEVAVEVLDGEGAPVADAGPLRLRTRSLPRDLPPLEVDAEPDRMTPGLTLFDAAPFNWPDQDEPRTEGYLVAVDGTGEVVWYHREQQSIEDVRQTSQGLLAFIYEETGIKEIDPLDGLTREWAGSTVREDRSEDSHGREILTDQAISVDTDQMHHEVFEMPDGNLATLSRELEVIDGFDEPLCDEPDDEFDGSYEMVADTIVIFDPDDGEVVDEWSLFDMVDSRDYTDRYVTSELCGVYLDTRYPDADQPIDWSHGNAVVLDEERDALIVSLRHLDQVFAVSYGDPERDDGELVWRLGDGGDFELTDGEWFYHQHAPEVQEDGSLVIYDNGNWRPGTDLDDRDAYPYSRAVRYELDTEAMTATEVWEHRPDQSPAVDAGLGTAGDDGGTVVYAPFIGDADVLPGPEEGAPTVLIAHGGQLDPPAQSPVAEGATVFGEIIEVDEATGEVVFHLRSEDPDGETGWRLYRADRIAGLYPPDWTVTPLG